jgi:GDPmannose 4,6-dehydratase
MIKQNTAPICGVSGQDGALLAKLLLAKGYRVIGSSRDAQLNSFRNLKLLDILDSVEMISISLNDFRSVVQALNKYHPVEVYNLAGQSSVSLSFEQPAETMESIGLGTLNLLEAIRFYNASSSECYGNTPLDGATESTPFNPRSSYAVAKDTPFWQVANYRDSYNLYACSGILFNHESILRPRRFVTQKIIYAAIEIYKVSQRKLLLGNIDTKRDWGWAPEFVEAIWLMSQNKDPEDFVIATGNEMELRDFVSMAFSHLGLDWNRYVEIDDNLIRPSDKSFSKGNALLAQQKLGWKPSVFGLKLVQEMIDCAI